MVIRSSNTLQLNSTKGKIGTGLAISGLVGGTVITPALAQSTVGLPVVLAASLLSIGSISLGKYLRNLDKFSKDGQAYMFYTSSGAFQRKLIGTVSKTMGVSNIKKLINYSKLQAKVKDKAKHIKVEIITDRANLDKVTERMREKLSKYHNSRILNSICTNIYTNARGERTATNRILKGTAKKSAKVGIALGVGTAGATFIKGTGKTVSKAIGKGLDVAFKQGPVKGPQFLYMKGKDIVKVGLESGAKNNWKPALKLGAKVAAPFLAISAATYGLYRLHKIARDGDLWAFYLNKSKKPESSKLCRVSKTITESELETMIKLKRIELKNKGYTKIKFRIVYDKTRLGQLKENMSNLFKKKSNSREVLNSRCIEIYG
jgi:hypothetical protein